MGSNDALNDLEELLSQMNNDEKRNFNFLFFSFGELTKCEKTKKKIFCLNVKSNAFFQYLELQQFICN